MDFELNIQSDFNSDTVVSENMYMSTFWSNILIIDDNLFTKTFLEKHLTELHCNVYTTSSCFEGLALYKSIPNAISIIIVNVYKQDMDVLTIYSIFKTLNPAMKIVLLVEPMMDLSLLSNLEIDSIIHNPITSKELEKIVQLLA